MGTTDALRAAIIAAMDDEQNPLAAHEIVDLVEQVKAERFAAAAHAAAMRAVQ